MCAGVHEVSFRIVSKRGGVGSIGVGVVAAADAYYTATRSASENGYVYGSNGCYFAKSYGLTRRFGTLYGTGDVVTVRLDLDADTVAFQKNGVDIDGARQRIAHDEYCFAFEARSEGNAVAIVR